jgi:hypothetical protein
VIAAGPSNLDVVTTDAIIRSGTGDKGRVYGGTAFPNPEDQRAEILRNNFVYASAAVRRSALDRIGGLNERTGSEYDAWVRLVLTGSVIGFINEPLAVYHLSPLQQSNDATFTLRAIVEALEWALARDDLEVTERQAAEAQLAVVSPRLQVATAVKLLRKGQPGARAAAFRTAATAGVSPSLRIKLVLAAAWPSAARRAMR